MYIRKKTIRLNKIVHTRFAQNLVNQLTINDIKSSVYIEYNGKSVNAKSIIGLLSMSFVAGNDIDLILTSDIERKLEKDLPVVLKLINEL